MNKIILKIKLTIFPIIFFSGCNPFAPALIDSEYTDGLGDAKTIAGFFQSFQYSYNMKDTVVYSNLLAQNFIFAYRNYDKGMDLTLTRDEDIITTYRLFNAAQNLDFIWNEIIVQEGNDIEQNISRNFNLTITFSSADIITISGKAYLILKRDSENDIWKLTYWRDESYY